MHWVEAPGLDDQGKPAMLHLSLMSEVSHGILYLGSCMYIYIYNIYIYFTYIYIYLLIYILFCYIIFYLYIYNILLSLS